MSNYSHVKIIIGDDVQDADAREISALPLRPLEDGTCVTTSLFNSTSTVKSWDCTASNAKMTTKPCRLHMPPSTAPVSVVIAAPWRYGIMRGWLLGSSVGPSPEHAICRLHCRRRRRATGRLSLVNTDQATWAGWHDEAVSGSWDSEPRPTPRQR